MKRLLCGLFTGHAQTRPYSVRWRQKVMTDHGPGRAWYITGGQRCWCGEAKTVHGEPVPEDDDQIPPGWATRFAMEESDLRYIPPVSVTEGWLDIREEIKAGRLTTGEALDRLEGLIRTHVEETAPVATTEQGGPQSGS